MNPIDKAITEAGGVGKLASSIGVVQSAVSNWRVRGSIPAEHCAGVEAATNGVVTRRELRPDDWQKIWPELAQAPRQPGPQDADAADADLGTYMGERVVFLSGERMPLRLATGDDRCVIVNEAEPAHPAGGTDTGHGAAHG